MGGEQEEKPIPSWGGGEHLFGSVGGLIMYPSATQKPGATPANNTYQNKYNQRKPSSNYKTQDPLAADLETISNTPGCARQNNVALLFFSSCSRRCSR